MQIPIVSLKDTLKLVLQSLQLATILPTSVFITINLFIIPFLFPQLHLSLKNEALDVILFLFLITLSYMLYAYNYLFIRFLEGYIGWDNVFLFWLKDMKVKCHQRNYKLYKKMTTSRNPVLKNDAIQYLEYNYPLDENYILPTRLGNAIAAFENYSFSRYGIDAVSIWSRLIPFLQKNNYIDNVAQQKSVFDLLLNFYLFSIILGFEFICVACVQKSGVAILLIVIFTYLVSYLLYIGLINTAIGWGETVRVSFDLYRDELWKGLRLKNMDPKYEKSVWKRVSQLIQIGNLKNEFHMIYNTLKKAPEAAFDDHPKKD